jgi:hypothetical protein
LFRHFASSPNLSNKLVQARPFQQCNSNVTIQRRPWCSGLPGPNRKESRCHGLTAQHGPVQSDIKAVRGGFLITAVMETLSVQKVLVYQFTRLQPAVSERNEGPATFDIWTQP